jgi:glycosyltransferase involved in cell wall biosynthesis
MSLISICYAVYQNEGALAILYNRTVEALETNFPHHEFEFVFVNDGSKDNSLNELLEIKKNTGDERIRIISFSRNFGQLAAILAGWEYANGDAVINMAADLQDPPEQCIPMIKEWESGNEIVISYRQSHSTSRINKITSWFAYKLLLPKRKAPPGGFDFVLLGKPAIKAIKAFKEKNRVYHYDILWIGFSVKFIPYDKLQRTIGKSQHNLISRFGDFILAYINTSYIPLRLMSLMGLLFAVAGFIYSIRIVNAYLQGGTPFNGWAPIMIMLLIIGGLIMVMLGVLGEYIWRIFDEVKHRPNYIVDKVL